MPKWMEPYRELIGNTGGDSIENLMNDHHSHLGNNAIRAALIVCVDSQVKLLQRLHFKGLLRSGKLAAQLRAASRPELGTKNYSIDAVGREGGKASTEMVR